LFPWSLIQKEAIENSHEVSGWNRGKKLREKNRTGNSQGSYEIKLWFANDMPQLPSLETLRKATALLTESDSTAQLSWLANDEGTLISNAILMGQTSVSFESMSSIMQEKTHKKRPYGSLGTPPIPALPGFPKNPQHSILQYHPRVSSSYCQARFFFSWCNGLLAHRSWIPCILGF